MRFELVKVTPEMAAKFLLKNDGNRKLREQHAAGLARAIENGKYQLTHQAAAVTKKGRLIDGQHRMRAIIMAGKPVEMFIAYDVPDDTFAVLDAGMPRKMHERLQSDPKKTSVCTSLFRIMVRNGKAQEYEVEMMLEIFEGALSKWSQLPKLGTLKGFTTFHNAAVALRIAMALEEKDADEVNRILWVLERISKGDLVGAPPIIHAFYRQMSEGVSNPDLSVSPMTDQFCRAWIAFNADNQSTPRLQIGDHAIHVREARVAFKNITEGVFES
jgi:hypothetical protein